SRVALSCTFFLYCSGDLRDLHSFPTRRSSDLDIRSRASYARCARKLVPNVLESFPCRCSHVAREVRCALFRSKPCPCRPRQHAADRKSTRLNSSHVSISYAVFCLKKKKITNQH